MSGDSTTNLHTALDMQIAEIQGMNLRFFFFNLFISLKLVLPSVDVESLPFCLGITNFFVKSMAYLELVVSVKMII